MDVTHGLMDFLSGCDTNPVAELNAWYHMMNCGFRMAFIGETDYPCITDERMGVGRSYVRLDHRPFGDSGYEAWVRGIAQGRLYCGDGRSHFLDFKVNGLHSGETDISLEASGALKIQTLVAARLETDPPENMAATNQGLNGWHLERSRVGTTRTVPVELVVNGFAVDKSMLVADGIPRAIEFGALNVGKAGCQRAPARPCGGQLCWRRLRRPPRTSAPSRGRPTPAGLRPFPPWSRQTGGSCATWSSDDA